MWESLVLQVSEIFGTPNESCAQTTPACKQALLTTLGQLLCSSHWHIGVLTEMSQSQGCLLHGHLPRVQILSDFVLAKLLWKATAQGTTSLTTTWLSLHTWRPLTFVMISSGLCWHTATGVSSAASIPFLSWVSLLCKAVLPTATSPRTTSSQPLDFRCTSLEWSCSVSPTLRSISSVITWTMEAPLTNTDRHGALEFSLETRRWSSSRPRKVPCFSHQATGDWHATSTTSAIWRCALGHLSQLNDLHACWPVVFTVLQDDTLVRHGIAV